MFGKRMLMIIAAVALSVVFVVPYIGYLMEAAPSDRDYVIVNYSGTFANNQGTISLDVSEIYGAEKESYWSYWSDFWAGSTGEIIPAENAIFAVRYMVLFEGIEGKEWIASITKEYNTAGDFQGTYEFDKLGKVGTYTINVSLAIKGATGVWNITIAWDKEVIVVGE